MSERNYDRDYGELPSDGSDITYTEDDCSVEFEQGIPPLPGYRLDEPLMQIALAKMNAFCHSNEFGERIPHIIALTPVDSSPVTDKILDAMEILR